MEQLGGVKLAFVSLELDEGCVVKKRPVSDDWWVEPIKSWGRERMGRAEYGFIWDNELLNLYWSDKGTYRKPKRSQHVNTNLQMAILFVFINLLRRTYLFYLFVQGMGEKVLFFSKVNHQFHQQSRVVLSNVSSLSLCKSKPRHYRTRRTGMLCIYALNNTIWHTVLWLTVSATGFTLRVQVAELITSAKSSCALDLYLHIFFNK